LKHVWKRLSGAVSATARETVMMVRTTWKWFLAAGAMYAGIAAAIPLILGTVAVSGVGAALGAWAIAASMLLGIWAVTVVAVWATAAVLMAVYAGVVDLGKDVYDVVRGRALTEHGYVTAGTLQSTARQEAINRHPEGYRGVMADEILEYVRAGIAAGTVSIVEVDTDDLAHA
jgi:hypothetical protein